MSSHISTRNFQLRSFSITKIEFPALLRMGIARNLTPMVLMCTGISLRKHCAFLMNTEFEHRFGYHTLASECKNHSRPLAGGTLRTMSKQEVLSILDHAWGFLTPDQIRARLQSRPDRRSMYSYLLRLHRQGLLERRKGRRGTLAYRLTERGRARLLYFQKREEQD